MFVGEEGNKYNTVIIKRLPGVWFGLSEDGTDWSKGVNNNGGGGGGGWNAAAADEDNDDFSIAPSIDTFATSSTTMTTATLRTNAPFLKVLRQVFSTW